MADFNALKATIDASIKANDNQEITGPVLNSTLTQMMDTLGEFDRRLYFKPGAYIYSNTPVDMVVGEWVYSERYIDVTPGDIIKWRFGIQNSSYTLIFCDAAKNLLTYYSANDASGERTIIAPANARYVRICWYNVYNGEENRQPLEINGYAYFWDDITMATQNVNSANIPELKRRVGIYDIDWEIGNIAISGSGWVYQGIASRVRTKEGTTLALHCGDVVGFSDYAGVRYYVGWRDSAGNYFTTGRWMTEDFVIPRDAEYVFLLSKNPESGGDSLFADLTSLFFVNSILENRNLADATFKTKVTLSGSGQTPQNVDFSTRIGKKYRVRMPEPWNVGSISTTSYVFLIRSKSGTTYTNITTTAVAQTGVPFIPKFFEFEATTEITNIFFRGDTGETLTFYVSEVDAPTVVGGYIDEAMLRSEILWRGNTRGVNHRGYSSIYPENTLIAFRGSAEHGFRYVETDVRFTRDGVPVLLHDESINRTARNAGGSEISGTVNIADISYEQALGYDFGIWRGLEFAGTKIPTLAEFLALCRNLGLHPYIELKAGDDASLREVYNMVRSYGFHDGDYTWISAALGLLRIVVDLDIHGRFGWITMAVNDEAISIIQSLKTPDNEVFANSYGVNSSDVAAAKAAGVPLESWFPFNSIQAISEMDDYVSGLTADALDVSKIKYIYQRRQ